ncbi:hypothetical protein BDQ17DRAFT_1335099 [Cyathus striatus]|nr:hypothetical protein BDQ17DRAFT_1335099 [Cyathus striatus]
MPIIEPIFISYSKQAKFYKVYDQVMVRWGGPGGCWRAAELLSIHHRGDGNDARRAEGEEIGYVYSMLIGLNMYKHSWYSLIQWLQYKVKVMGYIGVEVVVAKWVGGTKSEMELVHGDNGWVGLPHQQRSICSRICCMVASEYRYGDTEANFTIDMTEMTGLGRGR